MSELFTGKVEIEKAPPPPVVPLEVNPKVTITFDGSGGDISAGGNGVGGNVSLYSSDATFKAVYRLPDRPPIPTIYLDGQQANLRMGGKKADGTDGVDGDILLFAKNGDRSKDEAATIHLDADASGIHLKDTDGNTTIYLWGQQANLKMGGKKADGNPGVDGDILLFAKDGDRSNPEAATIHLDTDARAIRMKNPKGVNTIYLNSNHSEEGVVEKGHGAISLSKADGTATIFLDGGKGDIVLRDGTIVLKDGKGKNITAVYLYRRDEGKVGDPDFQQANLKIGGEKFDSHIWLFNRNGDRTNEKTATIHLNGTEGDIVFRNGDCAEDFDLAVSEKVEPGTVMVIDERGGLRPSTEAYDKKVAGVISGASGFKPGMVLDRQPDQNNRIPVALMGKVYCKVDADYAPIEVGDLLTTSATPGHAMKVTDPLKAFGTVIGKALKPLREGKGLLPILIALQ